ncbi:MAG: serine--tRNA ligase [Candidatus Diapherotrites archaeon]|uniref:Serine--tRNA ligase n=1 Tax=Candidatus Iainarchaeum sp. TaxID=3101447 RepID=A0A8T4C7P5_9ARCH|nr:serine--tRNA ligase [Candidatus Diapherotrites archaeon]
MLDIHFVREHVEGVRENLSRRQYAPYLELFDQVAGEDIAYRKALQEVEGLRAKRNQLTQQVAKVKDNPMEKQKLVQESRSVGEQIILNEKIQKELKEKIHEKLMKLPNLLAEDVPFGKDDTQNVQVKTWGEITEKNFEVLTHAQVAKNVDGAEFDRAVKISGTGFFALKGPLVLLDLALQRYALDMLMRDGFIPYTPPVLMNRAAYEGVTDLSDFGNQLYKIENEDLHLIATSEHPLTAQYMNETLPSSQLPIQLAGLSPCFRREVGKHGLDERGFFRVHQFNKIEQIVICSPEESPAFHTRMVSNTEKLFQGLGIPYRVVNVCTGDLGIVAAKKYDIEGWSPREKKYFELASLSNCTTYQAVRLNIKVSSPDGSKRYAHTLNATAIATARMLRAILENYQTPDGGFDVPPVLQPYMYGLTHIAPVTLVK